MKIKKITQELVEQIETDIIDGILRTGEKLPSEREMGEIFQTSRSSIREALRILEQKGLLDIKIGPSGGATVKPACTDCVKENLSILVRRQKVSLSHLAEFRESLEGNMVVFAARRATAEDITRLKKILKEMKDCIDKGISHWKLYIEIDEKFHIELARISQNPVFLFVLQVVHHNLTPYYQRHLLRRKNTMNQDYQDACGIVRSIEEGNYEEAKKRMRDHIGKFNFLYRFRSEKDESQDLELKWR